MPASLGDLAPELLYKITEFFFTGYDQPVPQHYLRLARVNKRFYKVFMSDRLWKLLDVHRVEKNISKHYIKQKAEWCHKELKFCGAFDFDTWRHPATDIEQFLEFSLYTQAGILAESHNFSHGVRDALIVRVASKELLLHAARTRSALAYATKSLWQDDNFMRKMASKCPGAIYYAPATLKGDKAFVLQCVEASSIAWNECSDKFKNDKDVVLAYYAKWGFGFEHVSEELRDDREVAMAAIVKDPHNLRHCSARLCNDRHVVMTAIKLDGATLKYASRDLKNDTRIVFAALKSNPKSFKFAGQPCQAKIFELAVAKYDEQQSAI